MNLLAPARCHLLYLVPLVLGSWGCSPEEPLPLPALTRPAVTSAPKDGNVTITSPGTVVNKYIHVVKDIAKGDKSISVDPTQVTLNPFSVSAGDLILVIQMQGASVTTTTDDKTSGTIANLNGAGLY